MKRNSINRRVISDRIKNTLKSKTPLPNSKRDQRYVIGSNIPPTLSNLMFVHINNFHMNSKLVLDESTRYHQDKVYERKSFFVQVKDDEYKCLICNSYVKKVMIDNLEVFQNPNGENHRQKLYKNQERGVICVFDTTPTKTEKKKHIGHMKPNDNSFMTIE